MEEYKRMHLEIKRLLGVFFNARGDLAPTGIKMVAKAKRKIASFHFSKGGPRCAFIITNTFLIPSIEWAVFVSKIPINLLIGLDKDLTKKLRPHYGLTPSDSVIHIMRPFKKYGGGCYML